ncbi:MAG: GNAT family N-acetyltransferase [Hyphomicrobiales bacterium]
MIIRPPRNSECEELSKLCLKSKAYWGYDEDFVEACREELTITETTMRNSEIAVAEEDGKLLGVVQLDIASGPTVLEKIFVAPEAIGKGVGKRLFKWAVAKAKENGVLSFTIDGDPNAVPFYEHMGAVKIGSSPSGSIPGRMLPQFRYEFEG